MFLFALWWWKTRNQFALFHQLLWRTKKRQKTFYILYTKCKKKMIVEKKINVSFTKHSHIKSTSIYLLNVGTDKLTILMEGRKSMFFADVNSRLVSAWFQLSVWFTVLMETPRDKWPAAIIDLTGMGFPVLNLKPWERAGFWQPMEEACWVEVRR